MLPQTSEEPSQSTLQISLLTQANALNRVFPLKAFATRGVSPAYLQPGSYASACFSSSSQVTPASGVTPTN